MKIKNTNKYHSSVPAFPYSGIRRTMFLTIIITLFTLTTIHPLPPNDHRMTFANDHFINDNRMTSLNDNRIYDHRMTILNDNSTNDNGMTTLNNAALSSPSEWIICGPASWEDLKNYLPEAKIAGVSVSVILLPPVQTTPVCTDGQFSEPFGNDYIRWAQEIASLSRRYSNLTQFGIYEFRENLNLGYLRPSYIDSLIAAGHSINPRLQFISPHKNFYVDRDATGNGSGTSWTDAATKLSLLNWTSIAGGDTIYISGGTDSTTYAPVSLWQKKYDGTIIITKGKDAGHNGDVYFVNPNNTLPYAFVMGSCRNIKITGLHFRTLATIDDSLTIKYLVRSNNGKNITIDNCNMISNGLGSCFNSYGDTNLVVTANYMEVLTNNYVSEADGIHIDAFQGIGSYMVSGNTIINSSTYNNYFHHDAVQIANIGNSDNRTPFTFANNLVVFMNYGGWGVGINVTDGYSASYLIYNNIILTRGTGNMGIGFQASKALASLRLFNNTILTPGQGACLQLADLDTLIMKNNILLVDTIAGYPSIFYNNYHNTGYSTLDYKDIDYNLYYKENGAKFDTSGISITFAQWQSAGNDINGLDDMPIFNNKWGTTIDDYALTSSSAGLNDGTDLSAYFTTDINGTTRSNWSLGAIEQ